MHDTTRRRPHTLLSRLTLALGWWIGLFIFWLLLVDTTETAEVVAALLAAAFTAALLVAATAQGMAPAAPRLGWLVLLAWRLPGRALTDCGVVFAALWRRVVLGDRVEGTFRAISFDPGDDDPRSAARRALLLAGISLPPNSFVVAIDPEAGRLLIHQLVPAARPRGGPNVEWPL